MDIIRARVLAFILEETHAGVGHFLSSQLNVTDSESGTFSTGQTLKPPEKTKIFDSN